MRSVFVSGVFNILHPGHTRLLRFAKNCGDKLTVAIQSDRLGGRGIHVTEKLRLESVLSISWVDEAFVYDEPLADVLRRIKPDFVIKGKEHELSVNAEYSVLQEYGGKIIFSSGESFLSSLDLIQQERESTRTKIIDYPSAFMGRHGIDAMRLMDLAVRFSTLRVIVVGDLIVDEYITCDALGLSQEDPSIVVTPVHTSKFLGGAGIVAAHAAGLGAKVEFFSISGQDTSRDFALESLSAAGVSARVLIDRSRPTTTKKRYRCKGKTLLRVSDLQQGDISIDIQNELLSEVNNALPDADVIVFSDFNYGALPSSLVNHIVATAKEFNVLTAADSQSSSQIGDISRFVGMDLITPTEREARIATRNRTDGLVVLAEDLKRISSARNVLLKLGEEGVLIHTGSSNCDWITDRIRALNVAPRDVAGAGDSLIICAALTLALDGSIWEAGYLGSLAAALQVSRVGNTPLNLEEFISELS